MRAYERHVPAGILNRRMTIETPTDTVGDSGGVTQTYHTKRAAWPCRIEALSSREYFAAAATQSQATHSILGRYARDITSADRGRIGTRIFNFENVIHDETMRRFTDIIAVEVV